MPFSDSEHLKRKRKMSTVSESRVLSPARAASRCFGAGTDSEYLVTVLTVTVTVTVTITVSPAEHGTSSHFHRQGFKFRVKCSGYTSLRLGPARGPIT
jgi:hypothetical protein